jgi:hypothetical protein
MVDARSFSVALSSWEFRWLTSLSVISAKTRKSIFISYKREDQEKVRPLVDCFEASGWSVWWDDLIPAGAPWDTSIETALDTAKCIVVVWSKLSVSSEPVRTEASEGRKRGILVPITIDNVAPPSTFRGLQTCDLTNWSSSTADTRFAKLLASIEKVVRNPPANLVSTATHAAEDGPLNYMLDPSVKDSRELRGIGSNVFLFFPEIDRLSIGIKMTNVIRPETESVTPSVCFGSTESVTLADGRVVQVPLKGRYDRIWFCHPDEPPALEDGVMVAATLIDQRWASGETRHFFGTPRRGSGYILKINTGLWGIEGSFQHLYDKMRKDESGRPIIENHGAVSLEDRPGFKLVAGSSVGRAL